MLLTSSGADGDATARRAPVGQRVAPSRGCALRVRRCAFPSGKAADMGALVGGVPGHRGGVQGAVADVPYSVRDRQDGVVIGAGRGDLKVGRVYRVLAPAVREADAGADGFPGGQLDEMPAGIGGEDGRAPVRMRGKDVVAGV